MDNMRVLRQVYDLAKAGNAVVVKQQFLPLAERGAEGRRRTGRRCLRQDHCPKHDVEALASTTGSTLLGRCSRMPAAL